MPVSDEQLKEYYNQNVLPFIDPLIKDKDLLFNTWLINVKILTIDTILKAFDEMIHDLHKKGINKVKEESLKIFVKTSLEAKKKFGYL